MAGMEETKGEKVSKDEWTGAEQSERVKHSQTVVGKKKANKNSVLLVNVHETGEVNLNILIAE